jgi:hypothetical protein
MHLQNTLINPNEVRKIAVKFEVMHDLRRGSMEGKFKNIKLLFTFSNGQVLPVIPAVFSFSDLDQ